MTRTTDHVLATQIYWEVAIIWNGRLPGLTLEQAFNKLHRAQDLTTTNHPVFWQAQKLIDDIVKNQTSQYDDEAFEAEEAVGE